MSNECFQGCSPPAQINAPSSVLSETRPLDTIETFQREMRMAKPLINAQQRFFQRYSSERRGAAETARNSKQAADIVQQHKPSSPESGTIFAFSARKKEEPSESKGKLESKAGKEKNWYDILIEFAEDGLIPDIRQYNSLSKREQNFLNEVHYRLADSIAEYWNDFGKSRTEEEQRLFHDIRSQAIQDLGDYIEKLFSLDESGDES